MNNLNKFKLLLASVADAILAMASASSFSASKVSSGITSLDMIIFISNSDPIKF